MKFIVIVSGLRMETQSVYSVNFFRAIFEH